MSEIATDIYIGNEIKRNQLGTGNFPAIKCGDVDSRLPIYFTKCISFVNPELIKRKRYFEHGDILIGKSGYKKTTVGSATAYMGKDKCILGGAVFAIKHNQNPKYLAFVLSSEFCRKQIEKMCSGVTIFNFCIKDIKKLKIPIPTLEEQEEIVSKLDSFRKITEDTQEGVSKLLTQFRKQYEYCAEKIFGHQFN